MPNARAIGAEIATLYHLLLGSRNRGSHSERLESFYGGQAAHYDAFRARLLKGREELYRVIPLQTDAVWVDLGGGTGWNLEALGDRIGRMKNVYIVDMSSSLLAIAQKRIEARGWINVNTVEADATTWVPPEKQADVVTFSYSLTMIPDWFAAIEQACRILKPGGIIGVVDFYVSRKHVDPGLMRHGWATRTFWPAWFGCDNVFLSPDHLPFLCSRFECLRLVELRARLPYLPAVKAPYYQFVGRKGV